MYDDLRYDEDPNLHCLEPTQHSWVKDSSYIKAHMCAKPHGMATCILGFQFSLCVESTLFVSITNMFCAL